MLLINENVLKYQALPQNKEAINIKGSLLFRMKSQNEYFLETKPGNKIFGKKGVFFIDFALFITGRKSLNQNQNFFKP